LSRACAQKGLHKKLDPLHVRSCLQQLFAAQIFFFFQGRVTRLGEFSPVGRLFSLGTCLEITEIVQFLGLLFPKLCINFDKGVGLHFGQFFRKLIWSPSMEDGFKHHQPMKKRYFRPIFPPKTIACTKKLLLANQPFEKPSYKSKSW
jgi:hypothetical protein